MSPEPPSDSEEEAEYVELDDTDYLALCIGYRVIDAYEKATRSRRREQILGQTLAHAVAEGYYDSYATVLPEDRFIHADSGWPH